jgi:hypothetical protein
LAAARKGGGVELLVAMLIAHAYWMRVIPDHGVRHYRGDDRAHATDTACDDQHRGRNVGPLIQLS